MWLVLLKVIVSSTYSKKNEIIKIKKAQNDSIKEYLNGVTSSVNEHNNHPSIKTFKDRMEQLDGPKIYFNFVSYNAVLIELNK